MINRNALNLNDRRDFAEFLAALVRRSPFTGAKAKEMVPRLLAPIIDPLLERAKAIANKERRSRAIANVNKVAADVMAFPQRVMSAAISQESDIPRFIEAMDWAFFYNRTVKFIASDNPFVYSISLGIGNPENGHIIFAD